MSYTAGFHFDGYRFTEGSKPILKDYSWWVDLVQQICKTATDFEIRCWEDETEAIRTGKQFGIPVNNQETGELVFKGELTPAFRQELLINYLSAEQCLKWFTLSFNEGDKLIFSSEHYGAEPYLFNLTEGQVKDVRKWAKDYPAITRVDVFSVGSDGKFQTG